MEGAPHITSPRPLGMVSLRAAPGAKIKVPEHLTQSALKLGPCRVTSSYQYWAARKQQVCIFDCSSMDPHYSSIFYSWR